MGRVGMWRVLLGSVVVEYVDCFGCLERLGAVAFFFFGRDREIFLAFIKVVVLVYQ